MSGFILCDEKYKEIAEIKSVLSAEHTEKLNGENILRFSIMLDRQAQTLITEEKVIKYENTYFELSVINKKQLDNGWLVADIECDHLTYKLADPDYDIEDYEFEGNPQDALNSLLRDTPFAVGIVEFSDNVELSKSGTANRRDLLMNLVSKLGGEIEYTEMSINIVRQRGNSTPHDLTDGQNIKIMEHKIDRRQKDTDGNSRHIFSCSLIKTDAIGIGDMVKLHYPALNINTMVRVFSITCNPYNTIDTSFEIGNFTDKLETIFVEVARNMSKENADFITEITHVTKEEVVAADNIHASSAFFDDSFVELLETNVKNFICRPVVEKGEYGEYTHTGEYKCNSSGGKRHYRRIYEIYDKYLEADVPEGTSLTADDIEPFKVGGYSQLYFTAIGDSPQAYQYYTFAPPKSKYPDMSDENAALFTVYIKKHLVIREKAGFGFKDITGDGNLDVDLVLGAGTGVGDTGRAHLHKTEQGLTILYTSRNSADITGTIEIRDDGEVYINGKIPGTGGGHVITDKDDTELPHRGKLQFTGSVRVKDDSENNTTKITVIKGDTEINDTHISEETAWSSAKINELLGIPNDILETALYSSTVPTEHFDGGIYAAVIDDDNTDVDTTWSSAKINEVLGIPNDRLEAALYGAA